MELNHFAKKLKKGTAALLVIDIQEKILPVINESQRVVENSLKLVKAFKQMELPVFYTEQYPKGLGSTEESIKAAMGEYEAFQKMTFSCIGAENLFSIFKKKHLEQIVVCGVEAHVCVQQTVLDLLANKFQVNVAVDAISSRKIIDAETAIRRMQNHGAEITTTEAAIFELLNLSGTEEFKAISKIVK